LDSSNKERIVRRSKESKAALELDMRIVKEFMKQDSVEKESKNRKKDELRMEMLEYKSYLEQMRAYEKMRDEELNNMYRSEEERIWNVKDAKWGKEQAARDRLMMQVLAGRKEQLRFACNHFLSNTFSREKQVGDRGHKTRHAKSLTVHQTRKRKGCCCAGGSSQTT
jgi:hypothetical protein